MKEKQLKNTPALDNKYVDRFYLYKTHGVYWVSFYLRGEEISSNDKIMTHNIEVITPDYVYRTNEKRDWAQLTATTKWGARRIVKRFLAGKIKDFKVPLRPLP